MTNLLKELEAVVAAQSNPKEWIGVALKFMDTHHAEIAEAVKDARRYRWLRSECTDQLCVRKGIGQLTGHALNAAIDAHNSAREGGE
jgi:hypothetical protein